MTVGGLGRDFDICSVIVPVVLSTGANTGHRIHMKNYGGICFVGYAGVGTAAEAPTFTVRQHDAATSGNSLDADVVAEYFTKSEAELDGDEAWVRATQTADAAVTDADWDDANEILVAFEVHAKDLTDGYDWVSVDVADPGAGTTHTGCVLAIPFGLKEQRRPDRLAQPNA